MSEIKISIQENTKKRLDKMSLISSSYDKLINVMIDYIEFHPELNLNNHEENL